MRCRGVVGVAQADRLEDAHHLVVEVDRAGQLVDLAVALEGLDPQTVAPEQVGQHRPDRAVADDGDVAVEAVRGVLRDRIESFLQKGLASGVSRMYKPISQAINPGSPASAHGRHPPEQRRSRTPESASCEAALEAFSELGFDGATTREIASRAGVNLGLIKYYFDSKLKLWRAAVDEAFEDPGGRSRDGLSDMGRARRVLDDRDTRDRTSTMIRRYVRFVAAHPEFVRLMHDEGKRGGPRMRWLVDRHVRPMYEGICGHLREDAQRRGLLPGGIDPLHWHYILAGSVGLIFHQAEECKRLTGLDPTDEAVVEAHADAVVHLLLGPEENA